MQDTLKTLQELRATLGDEARYWTLCAAIDVYIGGDPTPALEAALGAIRKKGAQNER